LQALFVLILLIAAPVADFVTAQSVTELPVVFQLPGMDKVIVKKDIIYKTDGEAKLKVEVYYPPNIENPQSCR